jgi:hypothetical protein
VSDKPEDFDLEFDEKEFKPNQPPPESLDDGGGVGLGDFVAYMQSSDYIYTPVGDFWPAARVNARVPPIPMLDVMGRPILDMKGNPKVIMASDWLASNAPVEQMTWIPGEPQIIRDKLVSHGGWIDRPGATLFNLYRPPQALQGDPDKAEPWLDHIRTIYPGEARHIVKWFAHRVQRPGEKINHGLVLGGPPGIGKDTFLEPIKRAVGAWNFQEVSPQHVLGRFNGYLKSVVLRINETKDMGEFDRFEFHNHMKTYLAAPPDVLRVDEKNLREHSVFNIVGPVMTTNDRTTSIYLPADDRRHHVSWSEAKEEDFGAEYWNERWRWYESGGFGHVAAYLRTLDLSDFDPKAPPRKTEAFWAIVNANRPTEDAEINDALDQLGRHDGGLRRKAVTLDDVIINAAEGLVEWLRDRKNRRAIPHRLEKCGYVPVRNTTAEDGLFVVNGRRQVIYGRADLSPNDRWTAAAELQRERDSRQRNPWNQ